MIGKIEKDWIRIELHQDELMESPRGWDNLGTMVCFHSRYRLGDSHNFESPKDFQEQITEEAHVILPLYLYDHSGLAINTTGFHCPWDSGQVGFIYVSK